MSNIQDTANALPQGAGSRLDADTLRKNRPADFMQLTTDAGSSFVSATATVNPGAITAGSTANATFTWGKSFTTVPKAWLGDVASGSNYSQMVLSLNSITKTGGTVTVFNPTAGSITPNFTIHVYGLGFI